MTKEPDKSILTARDLMAAAEECLLLNGYTELKSSNTLDSGRLFENSYNIVMITAFDAWTDLFCNWIDYQAMTVEAMSKFLKKTEMKAWDGYLVLLTPSLTPHDQLTNANEIRNNTSRLRKLLGTGEDIKSISDVQNILLPLLPMTLSAEISPDASGLDALPGILEKHNIDPGATETVIEAFKAKTPMLQRLHEYYNKNEN